MTLKDLNGLQNVLRKLQRGKDIPRQVFDIFNYLDSMQSFLRYISQTNIELKECQFIKNMDIGAEIEQIRKIVLEYIIPNGDVFHSFEN